MDLAVNARMSEYYERFIELQEKLRRSEEERMKLEMKFNDMMQKTREEEQLHYRKLRSQYKKFLEEDRKRQERNEKIIRTLERIEVRIDMLTSKTERFKSLRRQYQNYLKNVSSSQETKQVNSTRCNLLPKENLQNDALFQADQQKLNEDKMEILDRYLESISSERCKEIIEKRKIENAQLEKLDVLKDRLHNNSFDSNKAQTIAEDIMNSIYNRHYNKDQNDEQNYSGVTNNKPNVKLSFKDNSTTKSSDDDDYSPQYLHLKKEDVRGRTQEITKLDKELSNYQNGKDTITSDKIENDAKEKEKHIFVEDSHELRYVPNNISKQPEDVPEQKNEEHNHNPDNDKILDKLESSNKYMNKDFNSNTDSTVPKKNNTITNETDDFVEIKNMNYDDETIIEGHLNKYDSNKELDNEKSNLVIQKENENLKDLIMSNNNQVNNFKNTENVSKNPTEQTNQNVLPKITDEQLTVENINGNAIREQEILNDPNHHEEELKLQVDDNVRTNQHTENGQAIEYSEKSQIIQSNENQSDETGEALQFDKTKQPIQYDINDQPIRYDEQESAIQYDQNGQPIQYDGKNQPLQYDENIQPIQYEENGQPMHYNETDHQIQYDENGQQIQYDENGQQIQYDENGQPIQYDENGQQIQYDEHGQLIQYDGSNQQIQYDVNGQPIQFDGNGQPIQYDENGQPIQYDENGQQIQYDENGQPFQYDENGRPIYFDETGQRIQYDENGQPIQYDQSRQPIQYDENGQPIRYDENGQPIQYDENGQPIQYDENGQQIYYPQYAENGQLIQPLQDSGEVQLDETKPALNADNEPFGEKILVTTQASDEKSEFKGDDENKPKTNNILEMLDTDTESLQQNVSKISNDSDFTVSS
ncbi:unnamed protein product [Psylliodes chrysocephalus]|uniref:Uncharacterized protein n=1 Tax=Psylliodes chrysocephalus TaxID=3402493 RepID=A0A9P0GG67_9CUCU|nr:unnamed protein product [Psylliodes chrysocephala]